MTFASLTFIIFFLFVIVLEGITNVKTVKEKFGERVYFIRHMILLIASYIFYGWWDWRFCLLILFVTLTAYFAGLYHQNKIVLFSTICIVLVALGIFKYYNFFVESFCKMFSISSAGTLNIILPVGISFYTFQAISYIADVHLGRIKAEQHFVNVALYIAFFPQLVAGPIVKASEFLPQLSEDRNISIRNLETGLQIFVFGLFKKIVLADNLSVYVDEVFCYPTVFSAGTIALAVVSYAMQIYFDFSGYSDMAIGSAKCLGYDFSKNFNMPYISKNVSEFWKRWHISLSTWLKEYLYIPLGGNRKGKIRTYLNLMLTMALGGLWHGANWTFIVWGLLHGIALCVHKIFVSKDRKQSVVQNILYIIITNIFVCLCWIFFRADNISTAFVIIQRMFSFGRGVNHLYSWTFVSLFLMIVCHLKAYQKSKSKKFCDGYYGIMDLNKISSLIIWFVFIGLTIGLAYTGASPFIYFQF
ncbi:peptidoglycan O-acetyltransferase [Lachnospiraceae bacterium]|nr:peptidoglycan O-acetyltransferase [Lachnospiraceae bacterium]